MKGIEDYTKSLTEYLDEIVVVKEPKELYNPIRYIVSLGKAFKTDSYANVLWFF